MICDRWGVLDTTLCDKVCQWYVTDRYDTTLCDKVCQWLVTDRCYDTTLCDKVCQWLATVQWFSLDTLVSSTNKIDCQDITEILFKMALSQCI